jgi:RNase P/RNase MRP subunit POP5
MKALKPSMKEKKRYLLIKGKNLKTNIEKSIFDFLGVLGMSKTGMSWVRTSQSSAIICINREMVDKVRASLCICPDKIEVVKVSGTLKGLHAGRK